MSLIVEIRPIFSGFSSRTDLSIASSFHLLERTSSPKGRCPPSCVFSHHYYFFYLTALGRPLIFIVACGIFLSCDMGHLVLNQGSNPGSHAEHGVLVTVPATVSLTISCEVESFSALYILFPAWHVSGGLALDILVWLIASGVGKACTVGINRYLLRELWKEETPRPVVQ